MKTNDEVAKLFASFEERCFKFQGADAWRARDLMAGLGYTTWENFRKAIIRAWKSCSASGIDANVNFLIGDGTQPWRPEEVFREATKNPLRGRNEE